MANNITVDPSLSQAGANVPKTGWFFGFVTDVAKYLGKLDETLTGRAGQIAAVNADEDGLEFGVPVDLAAQTIGGYRAAYATELTTSTLAINADNAAAYTGKTLPCNSGSGQTVTIDLAAGDKFAMKILQKGAGTVTVAASGGLTLRNRQSHTGAAGQYSAIGLEIEGTNLWLYGDTA